MDRPTIFGLPATLVLDCGPNEIRVDNWLTDDDQAPHGRSIDFAAVADAIRDNQEQGGAC